METLGRLNSFQSGSIYFLNDENEEDYLLARCDLVESSINAVYLEKCPGGTPDEQYFKESGVHGQISMESLQSALITTCVISSVEKLYSVQKSELEEFLFSMD